MTLNRKYQWIGLAMLLLSLVTALLYWQRSIVRAAGSETTNHPALATSLPSPARNAEILDANDLLVLHFDNSLNGENGETPAQTSGTSFVAGISGPAINLPPGNLLTYQSAGNINAFEGTVEFWIKPNWNGSDNNTFNIFSWGVAGGLLIKKDPSTMSFSMNLFNAGGQPEIRAWPNISDWQANHWHHLACTWSNSNKTIKAYIDGQLKLQTSFTMSLPPINASTFRIGGFTTGSSGENIGLIDELRISGIERTAQEIAQHYLSSLTVTSLTVEPESLHQFPGWFWTPKLTAVTNLGAMQVPSAGINWQSSNPSVAIVQSDGRIKCLAPGNATLTANIQNATGSMNILVKAPVLPPEVGPVPASLATPPSDSLHTIPVLVLRYLPTADGVNIDTAYDADLNPGDHFPLTTLKSQIADYDPRVKFMLEEGSRFRGYSNPNAPHALGYKIVQYITIYEPLPPGPVVSTSDGNTIYRADYSQIFERWDVRQAVENSGVKEIWFWAVPCYPRAGRPDLRPESYVSMWESNMSSPATGDISNSNGDTADLPIYNKTYVVYSQNVHRTQAEAIHNHGHQLENILGYVNQLRDSNTDLWWGSFARAANNPPARCGNTHFPPNATQDYDYTNLNLVASDILNWQPTGGPTTMVNANTWGNVPYQWPGGTAPPQEVESKWYIFWFQSMAGRGNTIPYNSNRLTNWWQFTADWDAAIQGGLGLYEPGSCNYALSATSQQVPAAGGTFTVNVTGSAGCKWIASSNETWASVTGGSFGNGNGTVTFTVAAAGAARSGTLAIANQLFTMTQSSCPTITINPASSTLPSSGVGQAYNQAFSATGGTGAYTFSLSMGALPAGLTLNATTGVLSGTVGALGTFNFTVRATDENSCFGERAYSLAVTSTCPAITLNPNSGTVPNGVVGTPYSLTFSASGGAAPYAYSVLVGNLPLGLTLNAATGALAGTPTGGGSYSFTIRALDANNCTGARVYTILISGPCGFALTPASASFPATGDADFVNVATANGCMWTASSNNAWITIIDGATGNGNGIVAYAVAANAGPQRTGGLTIAAQTFTVTQSSGCPAISVSPSNATLPAGTSGAAYSQTFTQTGGTGATSFTISAGALPTGLSLNPTTGVLSGTPGGTGTFSFTVRATDANTCTGERGYTLTIGPGTCATIAISMALSNSQNSPLIVPVTTSDLSGRGVFSYDFTLMFDPAVLSVQAPVFDTAGTLSTGMVITPNTSVPGRITISAFGTVALGGAGTLLNLKFNLIGPLQACSDLVWVNFKFNEGTPCVTPANGRACVVGGTIAGAVSYCVTPAVKVSGVIVSANATEVQPSTTSATGDYLLSGFSGGAATVTPTKSGGGNGISSFDASLVAQHAAGLITLTSCQQKAGDGSNNGEVSSFDASLIAQFAAGISNANSIVNTWKFVPANRDYASVNGNLTGQNFDALLVGDVSGNWTPSGTAPSHAAAQVPISLPGVSGISGANLTIPITVGNLTGLGITAYDFDLMFNPDVLQPQASPVDMAGTLSSGLTITPNPMTGRLRVSAFGVNALTGAGTLLNLKFNVVGAPGASTALTWQSFLFNEEAQNNHSNGSVMVASGNNGLQFYPLPAPVRLLDTRSGVGGCVTGNGALTANSTRTQAARTACSTIPANATAIIGNITVVPSAPGYLTLFPSDATQPTVANSNFTAGEVTNNFFTVGLGTADGAFKIFTSAATEAIIDVTGYYAPPGTDGLFYHPLPAPVRLVQTFPGQTGCFANPTVPQLQGTNDPNANPALDLVVEGRGAGLPTPCNSIPGDAVVLVGNATTVFPQAPFGFGYLTIYPSDATRPTVASSNYGNNDIINGPFAVKLGADGKFKVYTFSTTHLVIDISGYYSASATDANGAGLLFNPLPKPMRLLETRDVPGFTLTGCYQPKAAIPGGTAGIRTQPAWGSCSDQPPLAIPTTARALVGNATVINPVGAGFGTFFPGDAGTTPTVATTNYSFPVLFGYNRHYYVGLSPTDGTFKILTQFTTDLIVDVSGYFAP